ncbi:MAG: hypothetical protein LBR68_06635 [Lachnoclostridium sp.]|jgi:hypothetical protein|nr:hypothetical protein [Lachnoclostridium sp.]
MDLAENEKSISLYAVWRKLPNIRQERELIFYEGEQVPIRIIKKYITAEDELDGDISNQIKIVRAVYENGSEVTNPDNIRTEESCVGIVKVNVKVSNSDDFENTEDFTIRILKNLTPVITVQERYFFQSEISKKEKAEQVRILSDRIFLRDDYESEEDLSQNITIDSSAVDFHTEGRYRVTVSVKDQYGHRFYMDENEKGQYGEGKAKKESFYVHIVAEEEEREEAGHVRFISRDYLHTFPVDSKWSEGPLYDKLAESFEKEKEEQYNQVWAFDREDIRKAKEFINTAADPFSKETNQRFYEMLTSLNCFEGGYKL